MPTIAQIAAELNVRAEEHAIGRLQELRRALKGTTRLPTHQLFDSRTIFEDYAFHIGGRTELQFNIGFESLDGRENLRYGVGFSLEPSQTLPDISVLMPKLARFNEFLRNYPDEFTDLRMWHHLAESRSTDYPPSPIPPELAIPHIFVFMGGLQAGSDIDYGIILDTFDRLLPLYRYVEGNLTYPAISEEEGKFNFVPGCTVKPATTNASSSQRELDVRLRHNEIQLALYRHLSTKHGAAAVGTEQPNGAGARIDLVVRHGQGFWFYEIKTALSSRSCIREALAQLVEYSFWPNVQEAERLVIVGEAPLDDDTQTFMARLRDRFTLPIYYERFDMQSGKLDG